MQKKQFTMALATGAVMLLVSSCGKQETSVSNPAENANKPAQELSSEKSPVAKPQETVAPAPPVPLKQEASAVAAVPTASTPSPVPPPNPAATVATNSLSQAGLSPAPVVRSNANVEATASDLPAGVQTVAHPAPPATNVVPVTTTNTATNVLASLMQKALDVQKSNVNKAATSATNLVQAATGTATNQVQALIERAKGLMNNQKYQEALGTVQNLYTNKLTPTQQVTVDNLATQLKTALAKQAATNATSLLGGFLGGKK